MFAVSGADVQAAVAGMGAGGQPAGLSPAITEESQPPSQDSWDDDTPAEQAERWDDDTPAAASEKSQSSVAAPKQPRSAQPAPQGTQPAPQSTQPAPQSTQPAPQGAQPAPQSTEPAPQSTEPAPRSAQPAPQRRPRRISEQPKPKVPSFSPASMVKSSVGSDPGLTSKTTASLSDILLSPVDISQKYEVVEFVSERVEGAVYAEAFESLKTALRRRCLEQGANAVIHLRIEREERGRVVYGTGLLVKRS
jgi:hypothetical protein